MTQIRPRPVDYDGIMVAIRMRSIFALPEPAFTTLFRWLASHKTGGPGRGTPASLIGPRGKQAEPPLFAVAVAAVVFTVPSFDRTPSVMRLVAGAEATCTAACGLSFGKALQVDV